MTSYRMDLKQDGLWIHVDSGDLKASFNVGAVVPGTIKSRLAAAIIAEQNCKIIQEGLPSA